MPMIAAQLPPNKTKAEATLPRQIVEHCHVSSHVTRQLNLVILHALNHVVSQAWNPKPKTLSRDISSRNLSWHQGGHDQHSRGEWSGRCAYPNLTPCWANNIWRYDKSAALRPSTIRSKSSNESAEIRSKGPEANRKSVPAGNSPILRV